MRIYNITFSPTGGTEQVAKLLLEALGEPYESISLLNAVLDYNAYSFNKNDVCLIAVPSYGGRVPAPAVRRVLSLHGHGARCILLCVYGNRAYEDTLLELKNAAKLAGFVPVAAVAANAQHSLMPQFGANRPDLNDMADLKAYAAKLQELLSSGRMDEVHVPGNVPYKDFGGVPMKPQLIGECSGCGLCVRQCPVGAIDEADPSKLDAGKCITCMRCVKLCPKGARGMDEAVMAEKAKLMAPLFAGRKPNELFL